MDRWYRRAVELRRSLDCGTLQACLQAALRLGNGRRWYERLTDTCRPDASTLSLCVYAAARARNFTATAEWLREAAERGLQVERIAQGVLAKEEGTRQLGDHIR